MSILPLVLLAASLSADSAPEFRFDSAWPRWAAAPRHPLVAINAGDEVHLLDTRTLKPLWSKKAVGGVAAFDPLGRWFLVFRDNCLYALDARDGSVLFERVAVNHQCDISPDGRLLACEAGKQNLAIWDLEQRDKHLFVTRRSFNLETHGRIFWMRFSPDGKHLLVHGHTYRVGVTSNPRVTTALAVQNLHDVCQLGTQQAEYSPAQWIGADRFLQLDRRRLQTCFAENGKFRAQTNDLLGITWDQDVYGLAADVDCRLAAVSFPWQQTWGVLSRQRDVIRFIDIKSGELLRNVRGKSEQMCFADNGRTLLWLEGQATGTGAASSWVLHSLDTPQLLTAETK